MNQPLLKKLFSLALTPHYALLTTAAWIMLIFSAYAQTTVSGKVTTSEDSSPLPGVNILVKGTAAGTITDADGNFSIAVPSSDATLVFSFVGYVAQEVPVNGRSSFDVSLNTDSQQLSEVVITALGIERETRDLGYAVQEVNGDQMTKARETNVGNAIAYTATVTVFESEFTVESLAIDVLIVRKTKRLLE